MSFVFRRDHQVGRDRTSVASHLPRPPGLHAIVAGDNVARIHGSGKTGIVTIPSLALGTRIVAAGETVRDD
jgi:hypothetical protein